jgi:23S rRNA pseudouridine1911/1915/1917 synthase
MTDSLRFAADRGDARLRLDQVLVRRVTELKRISRSVAQRWIAAGAVTIDGRVARRPSDRVREGAAIEITVAASAARRSRPAAQAGELDILFEDALLIAVNKPPGIVVHPTYKQIAGTLLNAVLWRLRDRAGVRPGILTRLDKDTSGLVIIALTPEAHATMQRDAAAGRVKKEYLAVVTGAPRPRQGRIIHPLGRDPADRRRVVVTAGGAQSETRYEVVASGNETADTPRMSVLRCELITGRTHQIRVHLAARGWPIVGDRLYGVADPAISRQALHAWRISLPHPVTRAPLEIEAPLPTDITALLQNFTL